MILLIYMLLIAVMLISIIQIKRLHQSGILHSPASLFIGLSWIHIFAPSLLFLYNPLLFVNSINIEFLEQAVLYSLLCVASFLVGHSLFYRFSAITSIQFFNSEIRLSSILVIVFFMSIIGWISRYKIIVGGAYLQLFRTVGNNDIDPSIWSNLLFAENLPFLSFCLLAIYYFSTIHKPKSLLLGCCIVFLIFIELIYWFPTGRKETLILSIISPFLIRYYFLKSLPSRRTVISLCLTILMIFPVSSLYRASISAQDNNAIDIIDALSMISSIGDAQVNQQDSMAVNLIRRLSFIEFTSGAIRISSQGHSRKGEDYLNGLKGAIPSILYDDKPQLSRGNAFGYDIGLIRKKDMFTSVSPTYFGESFLNLGWYGFTFFLIYGVLAAFIFKLLCSNSFAGYFVYTCFVMNFLYLGGTFSIYFSGIAKNILFGALIIFLIYLIQFFGKSLKGN